MDEVKDLQIRIGTGPMGSDCTSQYYVYLNRKCTIGEFIKVWLKSHHGEWGSFSIYKEGDSWSQPSYQCLYSDGKIKGKELPQEILGITFEKVHGSGGWSRSDFCFYIY